MKAHERPTKPAERGQWEWDLGRAVPELDAQAHAILGTALDSALQARGGRVADLIAASKSGSVRLILSDDCGAQRRLRIDFTVEPNGAGGEPILHGAIEDVTHRKANSQAVLEIAARLSLALETGHMAAWEYDAAAGKFAASADVNRLLGFPLDKAITLEDLTEGVSREDSERIRLAAKQALERRDKKFEIEYRRRGADGVLRWFFTRADLIFASDGALLRAAGVLSDISPVRIAADTNAYLAAVVLSSADAIVTFDHAGEILTWNESAERIFGYDKEEAIGRPIDMLQPSHADDSAARIYERVWAGELVQFEGARQRRDSSVFHAEITAAPVRAPNGGIVSIVLTVRDASSRKDSERRQALLVRELHHRVRNTLATVQAIAGASARYANSLEEFREVFALRINSLAQAHAILTDDNWQSVGLRQLMLLELKPYADVERISLEGPAIVLDAKTAIPISMAIHELTTNAAKHGALSTPNGRIEVSWRLDESGPRTLDLTWREISEAKVNEPRHRGFGFLLLNTILKMQLDARTETEYAADGLRYRLSAPLSRHAREVVGDQAARAAPSEEASPAAAH